MSQFTGCMVWLTLLVGGPFFSFFCSSGDWTRDTEHCRQVLHHRAQCGCSYIWVLMSSHKLNGISFICIPLEKNDWELHSHMWLFKLVIIKIIYKVWKFFSLVTMLAMLQVLKSRGGWWRPCSIIHIEDRYKGPRVLSGSGGSGTSCSSRVGVQPNTVA